MSKYIELAKKLKALAEKGIDGEKINAEKLLKKLMQKHNISEEDLESFDEDLFFFKINSKSFEGIMKRELLAQICALNKIKLRGEFSKTDINFYGLSGNFAFFSSKLKFIEIEIMLEFYLSELLHRFDEFYYAFCFKNDLLAEPEGDETKEYDKKEIEKLQRAIVLSQNMKKSIFRKQINN